jgi:hypothetical protein
LVLPQAVVKRLGLRLGDKINVRYADGRRAQPRESEGAYLELLGRHDTFKALVEPKRDTALIGAIVLEALDLLVDCSQQPSCRGTRMGLSTRSNRRFRVPHSQPGRTRTTRRLPTRRIKSPVS